MNGESLSDVAARCSVTRMTVWRWYKRGVSVGGRVVKLAARRIGGRLVVTREAWIEFDRDCNPQAPTLPESPSAEKKRFERERAALSSLLG